MKKLCIYAVLLAFMTIGQSCSMAKKLIKQHEKQHVITHSDSTSSTTTTETTNIDTTAKIKGNTAQASKPLTEVEQGSDLTIDNPVQNVVVHYNPKSGKLEATATKKPETIHIQAKKEVRSETNTAVKKTENKKTNAAQKQVDKKEEPGRSLWWLWLILGIIIAVAGTIGIKKLL